MTCADIVKNYLRGTKIRKRDKCIYPCKMINYSIEIVKHDSESIDENYKIDHFYYNQAGLFNTFK